MENKAQQKRIEQGEKIYEDFVERFTETFDLSDRVSNPRTHDLEMYVLLSKRENLKDFLYREMAQEYFSNFKDVKISVEKGKLIETFEVTQPLTK